MTLIANICAILLVLAMYFSPTALAFSERRRSAVAIAALNAFLGWTIVFWFVALVWATIGASREQPGTTIEVGHADECVLARGAPGAPDCLAAGSTAQPNLPMHLSHSSTS